MVHTDVSRSLVKGPFQEVKKDKPYENAKPSSQKAPSGKEDKHGAWGSVYKSKQNFIDMHFS